LVANGGSKTCYALPNVDIAELYYAKRFEELANDSQSWQRVHLLNYSIGSARAQRSLGVPFVDASGACASSLHPAVAQLVNDLFSEAVGRLQSFMQNKSSPLGTLSVQQVQTAEAVLLEMSHLMQHAKTAPPEERIRALSDEFNSLLPTATAKAVSNMADVAEREELVGLLKSLLTVGESSKDALFGDNAEVRYRALGCTISHVDPATPEHARVLQALQASQKRAIVQLDVVNVFAISRRVEREQFKKSLPNQRTLYHGSRVSSWVGILSKGLQTPLVHGETRRDYGLLGAGIYFASDVGSNVQYTTVGVRRGTRFVLSCTVALGAAKQYTSECSTLVTPPPGFHSVHGIAKAQRAESQFMDDEFVVFDAQQQV
jgi:poly [ADP-ribose] polymerase